MSRIVPVLLRQRARKLPIGPGLETSSSRHLLVHSVVDIESLAAPHRVDPIAVEHDERLRWSQLATEERDFDFDEAAGVVGRAFARGFSGSAVFPHVTCERRFALLARSYAVLPCLQQDVVRGDRLQDTLGKLFRCWSMHLRNRTSDDAKPLAPLGAHELCDLASFVANIRDRDLTNAFMSVVRFVSVEPAIAYLRAVNGVADVTTHSQLLAVAAHWAHELPRSRVADVATMVKTSIAVFNDTSVASVCTAEARRNGMAALLQLGQLAEVVDLGQKYPELFATWMNADALLQRNRFEECIRALAELGASRPWRAVPSRIRRIFGDLSARIACPHISDEQSCVDSIVNLVTAQRAFKNAEFDARFLFQHLGPYLAPLNITTVNARALAVADVIARNGDVPTMVNVAKSMTARWEMTYEEIVVIFGTDVARYTSMFHRSHTCVDCGAPFESEASHSCAECGACRFSRLSCVACSFINPAGSASSCQACHTSLAKGTRSLSRWWSCASCSFQNNWRSVSTCLRCGVWRSDGSAAAVPCSNCTAGHTTCQRPYCADCGAVRDGVADAARVLQCPWCSTPCAWTDERCLTCGGPFSAAWTRSLRWQPVRCAGCGTQNSPLHATCRSCQTQLHGTALAWEEQSRLGVLTCVCPAPCGQPNPLGALSCSSCAKPSPIVAGQDRRLRLHRLPLHQSCRCACGSPIHANESICTSCFAVRRRTSDASGADLKNICAALQACHVVAKLEIAVRLVTRVLRRMPAEHRNAVIPNTMVVCLLAHVASKCDPHSSSVARRAFASCLELGAMFGVSIDRPKLGLGEGDAVRRCGDCLGTHPVALCPYAADPGATWTCQNCGEGNNRCDVTSSTERFVCRTCACVRPVLLEQEQWTDVWECNHCLRATPLVEDVCMCCEKLREADEAEPDALMPFIPCKCGLCSTVHFEALCPHCSSASETRDQIFKGRGVISAQTPQYAVIQPHGTVSSAHRVYAPMALLQSAHGTTVGRLDGAESTAMHIGAEVEFAGMAVEHEDMRKKSLHAIDLRQV